MNKSGILALILAIILLVGGYFLFSKERESQTSEPIKIGALLSLTGVASAWGENSRRGIELAVEETNENGGIDGRQIEIIYEDTATDPKVAISAFQKVITLDHVVAIIGPLNTTEDASVIPQINKINIPTIIPGFFPLKDRKNIYNPIFIWTDAELESGNLAQYVYDQGVRRVGVIGTLDAWESTVTNGFVNKFKALGGTISALEIVQPSAEDMRLSVTKVTATKPEAIYLGTYYQFVNSLKELSNQGYKGKLYGIEVDDYLVGETSKWSSGLKFIAPDYYTISFINNFENKYGMAPGIPAGQSYDAAKILFSLIEEGEDQDGTLQAMKGFKEYKGVSGKISISSEGRTSIPLAIFQVTDGKVTRIESIE